MSGPAPLTPPASFDKPTPASRAKAKAQALLDKTRADALALAGPKRLVPVLARAQRRLESRLAAVAASGGEPLTELAVASMLVQLREALAQLAPEMRGLLEANAKTCAKLGAASTVELLAAFEGASKGALRPLSVPEAVAAERTVLERHASSVERYGLHVVGTFRDTMQEAMLVGDTFAEATERLRADGGLLLRTRGWAERIARTEGMHALNAGAHAEMLAQREGFGDLKKKLIETFDARTAEDSYPAHGQVRELEGLFEDGAGRQYLHPPGRPNDRGVQIPWRDAWKEPDRQAPTAETGPPASAPPPAPPEEPAAPAPLAPAPLAPAPAPAAPAPTQVAAAPAPARKPVSFETFLPRLRNAVRASGGEPSPEVRDVLRGLTARMGLHDFDVSGGRPKALAMSLSGPDEADAGHALHAWDGEVVVSPGLWKAAKKAASALKDAKGEALGAALSALPTEQRYALGALLHEQLHATSPAERSSYVKSGLKLEEAVNETLTRVALRRLGGLDRKDRTPGVALPLFDEKEGRFRGVSFQPKYDTYIEDLFQAAHVVAGGPAKALPKRLEGAMVALRSGAYRGLATPEAHFEALADALGHKGRGAELQAEFERLQKERKAPKVVPSPRGQGRGRRDEAPGAPESPYWQEPQGRYVAPPLGGRRLAGRPVDIASLPEVDLHKRYPRAAPTGEDDDVPHPGGESEADFNRRMLKQLEGAGPEERKAVKKFTGPDYTAIRLVETADDEALLLSRLGSREAVEAHRKSSEQISGLFKQARPEPGTVFRGVDGLTHDDVQKILTQRPGFGLGFGGKGATSSATWDIEIAVDFFMNGDEDPLAVRGQPDTYKVLYVIHGRSQVGVAPISKISMEREMLISKEARFRAVSVARHEGTERVLILELEEV
ncbi:MAG TPA: hypothetical protein VFS43_38325 [Polyangiaceae bacterium]|nr:hypothetical protein [Polyangiaceae bacterium]